MYEMTSISLVAIAKEWVVIELARHSAIVSIGELGVLQLLNNLQLMLFLFLFLIEELMMFSIEVNEQQAELSLF